MCIPIWAELGLGGLHILLLNVVVFGEIQLVSNYTSARAVEFQWHSRIKNALVKYVHCVNK
jgi:hypothetical protein